MPAGLAQPVPQINFMVTMMDASPAGLFGAASASLGGQLAGALASTALSFVVGGFSEVSGLDAEMEVETYHQGGDNATLRKFFKGPRYANITLKRGVTFNGDLWDWHRSVVEAPHAPVRKNGIIVLLDRNGPTDTGLGIPGLDRTPVAAWMFRRALPERVQGPQLNAKGKELAIESIEMTHEGLFRVSLSMIPGGLFGAALTGAAAGVSALV